MTVFRAKEPFAFDGKDGVPRVITAGSLMSDADPDFKGKEQLFEPVEVAAERVVKARTGVEEATSEPNTKRSVSTVKKGGPTHPADADQTTKRKTEENK